MASQLRDFSERVLFEWLTQVPNVDH